MYGGRCSTGVLRLQCAAVDLAGPEARKRLIEEDKARRDFELCDALVEEGAQLIFGQPVPRVNDGDWHFPKPLVGHSEHSDFRDFVAGIAGGLDLRRGNILAAADDDL